LARRLGKGREKEYKEGLEERERGKEGKTKGPGWRRREGKREEKK